MTRIGIDKAPPEGGRSTEGMDEELPPAFAARKLALWHTQTFQPITTHEELEPILATLGFVTIIPDDGNTGGSRGWTEYGFAGKKRRIGDGGASWPFVPRVRLPSPRIDGLHVLTYRTFCDAVTYHIGALDISDIFHVRGMPLNSVREEPLEGFKRFHGDEGQYFYRDGTFDHEPLWSTAGAANTLPAFAHADEPFAIVIRRPSSKGISKLVALKDIIV